LTKTHGKFTKQDGCQELLKKGDTERCRTLLGPFLIQILILFQIWRKYASQISINWWSRSPFWDFVCMTMMRTSVVIRLQFSS